MDNTLESSKESEERSIEENFKLLDDMIKKLESPDISLEASFQLYKEGMNLLKECNDNIDKVEKKMLQIGRDGELSEF